VYPTLVRDGLAIYRIGDGEPVLLFPYPHTTTVSSIAEHPLVEMLMRLGGTMITFNPPGAYA